MHHGERIALAHLRADRRERGQADGMVDRVLGPRAPAAERHHGEPDRRACAIARDHAGSRRGTARTTGAFGRYAALRSTKSAGPPSAATMRPNVLRRRAAVQRVVGAQQAFLVGRGDAGRLQHLGGQRQRHFEQPLARGARPVRKSTAFGTSTALPAAEASGSFMSVISARGLQARAVGHLDQAVRQLAGVARFGHEGAVADLHVEHQRLAGRRRASSTGSRR